MTLVAAFTSQIGSSKVPVLIGDLVLSDLSGNRSGARRKIQRVRRNLAIGWCDSFLGARVLFRELGERLPEKPTLEDVRDILVDVAPDIKGHPVELSGWLLAPEAIGFRWISAMAGSFDQISNAVIGSGATTFEQIASNSPQIQKSEPGRQDHELAVLTLVSNLTQLEMETQPRSFGMAYDVLIGDSDAFSTPGVVVYSSATAQLDANFEIAHLSGSHGLLRHWIDGEFTLIRHIIQAENTTNIHIVSPIFDAPYRAKDKQLLQWLTSKESRDQIFDGDYLLMFIDFVRKDGQSLPPLTMVIPRGSPVWVGSTLNGVSIAAGPLRGAVKEIAQRAGLLAPKVS